MTESAGSPLGQPVTYDSGYAPGLLYPIVRSEGRDRLGLPVRLPFTGVDIWNAWEISWLDLHGKPVIAWGEFRVPADTPNIIESKSLKLYLNSLNQERLGSLEDVQAVIARDLSAVAGGEIACSLLPPAQWPQQVIQPRGHCLDESAVAMEHYQPKPDLLSADPDRVVEETLHSHLLRSLCPVTGQPDWGAVVVDYRGPAMDRDGLLAYIVSFRQHQDFHEQCVERMFRDIQARCAPEALTIQARYLRRGGLDINPVRSNTGAVVESGRWFLQ